MAAAAVSLDRALRLKAAGDPSLAKIAAQLDEWSNEAAFKPVFDFYAGVLGRDGVRRKLVARLGPEAGDILDEFLNFCLAQEKTGTPGLEAFLATLESTAPEIKREMDQGRAEVRIMTAHAAKGLEAPVVFPGRQRRPAVQRTAFAAPAAVRCRPASSGRARAISGAPPPISPTAIRGLAAARIKEAAEEEYRRLLYVGMTRAEDRLIVCGYYGKIQPTAGTWHGLVSAALASAPEAEALPDPLLPGTRHRFRVVKQQPPSQRVGEAQPLQPSAQQAPAWLRQPVPPEPLLPRPLTPSRASASIEGVSDAAISPRSPVLDAGEEPSLAIARGLAVHRLLQILPGLAEDERDGGGAALRRARRRCLAPRRTRIRRALGDAGACRSALRPDLLAGFAGRGGYCRHARNRRRRAGDLGQDRPARGDRQARC